MRRACFRSLLLLSVLLAAGPVWGQAAGRISAEVVDSNGKPIEGVQVTITTSALTDFLDEHTTSKRGKFVVSFVDATKTYEFKFEKEGYRPLTQTVKPTPGDNKVEKFTLYAAGEAAPTDPPDAGVPLTTRGLTEAQKAFNDGVEASQKGDRDGALAKFEEASQLDPELAVAHRARANLYLQVERHQDAVEAVEKALVLEPTDIQALEIAYDAYSVLGNQAKADEYLAQLSSAGGGNLAPRYFNAGVGALNLGDRQTAKRKFQQALEQDPNLVEAHSALAVVLIQLEEFEAALQTADRALALEPDNARAKRMRYQALRFLGRDAEAKAAYDALDPKDRQEALTASYNQGVELFNAGETAKAMVLFEEIVANDPGYARAHFMLGLSYVNTGDNAKAKEHFNRFLALAPNDPDATTAKEMLSFLN
jgi:tetratricopeptide (TPR) repeat protein